MTGWLVLDGLTLLLAGAYALSLPLAALPLPSGDAGRREREALRRLWFPLVGSVGLVAIGCGSAWWDAWRQTADHCGSTTVHEPFLCWLHPVAAAGVGWGEALGIFALSITVVLVVAQLVAVLRGRAMLAQIAALGNPAAAEAARRKLAEVGAAWPAALAVVPSDEAVCFVFGVRRPTLVLSTRVLDGLGAADLAAVVAHERAHVERRETVWRALGRLVALVHVPGLGREALRRWSAASEAVCDDAAALRVGSRLAVAEALLRFRRLAGAQRPTPGMAAGITDGDLASRVKRLVRADGPAAARGWWEHWPWALLVAGVAIAPGLHWLLEEFLRALHAAW